MPAFDQIPLVPPGVSLPKVESNLYIMFENELLFPVYAVFASAIVLTIQIFVSTMKNARTKEPDEELENLSLVNLKRLQKHVSNIGGCLLFVLRSLRFSICVVLVILSCLSISKQNAEGTLHDYGIITTYIYTSLLAFVSVAGNAHQSITANDHLVLVLLFPWVVFLYRDVWPLATYTLAPIDGEKGWIIWTQVSLLTIVAAIIPLISPRRYVPFDPAEPMPSPNEEQTASWLSYLLFSYCDGTILKAYNRFHITIDDLPVLADSVYAKNLVKHAYPYLDPLKNKKRHLFNGLAIGALGRDYLLCIALLFISAVSSLISPIGMNRLLNFMETGGENTVVRPWFWIAWMFFGPMLSSVANGRYFYTLSVIIAKGRSIMTQLMFDHALRLRMKADATEASSSPSTVATEENSETNSASNDPSTESSADPSSSNATPDDATKKDEDKEAPIKEKGNISGKINNLITADLSNVVGGADVLRIIFYTPLQLILVLVMLYNLLGWSVFVGISVMIIAVPVPSYLAKLMHGVQTERMNRSDARVQNITETLNVVRMVKLFGWETKMEDALAQKRNEELKMIRKSRLIEMSGGLLTYIIPVATTVTTFATFTLIMKRDLTASLVFPAITMFSLIEGHFGSLYFAVPRLVKAKVSLDRIEQFLKNSELLDEYANGSSESPATAPAVLDLSVGDDSNLSPSEELPIGIRASAFTWTIEDADEGSTATVGTHSRKFKLKIEDEVFFKKGCINLIVGPTGSGKTSLLMALLGEMHHIPLAPNALVSLPRHEGIAYHAQESWVLNETIRENILFGSPYDEVRYNAVIVQCGLKHDLSLFDAGDSTEVGEKGITLSGGQKARITLARAIYSPANILLLDDVLAALDVHTAKWIVERCLKGELVRGRTVILVTHNIALASPIADYVVSLDPEGKIRSQGSLSTALEIDQSLSAELAKESQQIAEVDKEIDEESPDKPAKKAASKLIVEEEVEIGHVSWSAMKLLFENMRFDSMGGKGGIFFFWVSFTALTFLFRMATVVERYILTMWSDQYEHHPSSEVSVSRYIVLYSVCVLASAILMFVSYAIYVFGGIRASRIIHALLIDKMFGTTLRWLDRTPVSRIITRCTEDIQSVDDTVWEFFYLVFDITVEMVMKFFAVFIMSPAFGGFGILLTIVGGTIGNIYMKAQLPIKRESSKAKAPVMGHFSTAISGLVSIRAYGAQERFRVESFKRTDRMTRTSLIFFALDRWLGTRISALSCAFTSALAAYLVYSGSNIGSANTGFSLSMASSFSGLLQLWIRIFNIFETSCNSLERINQYLVIEQEPKPTPDGVPPAYWPASGDLRAENLSARYSPDGPEVLKDINFHVKSGERIGIVGRTGSGKSSLTLALLRCILTEGAVYYDNIPTKDINLDILRSNITIIPQVPELLSGTLRQNLDPFSQYDDATLNDALRASGLFSLQNDSTKAKITLDTQISSGGGNLSVGQRQILALARAIIRQSKLLILDEATSAIDYETDTIIQNTLRKELSKDVTLLTVAHRLQTIMDADKVMVLDSGHIVEFDKPSVLLENREGMLRSLVDESVDREKLYSMALGVM
ncbi:hypothetical protein C8Q75DRAFT_885975 [Abortiporus biennis]|nr:hypothetical protein C8Q75DRAFT_885975 [Abortiporus biennis]